MEFDLLMGLTKFFAMPKGINDLQMVYDASVSGLNEVIWTPSFMLMMPNVLVRVVTLRT